MRSTFAALNVHIVFATKGRLPWISTEIEKEVWPYLGGLARDAGMSPLRIGGVDDHIHALLGISRSMTVSWVAQRLKGASSRWIRQRFPGLSEFAWQDGYGAFSVSASAVPTVSAYICHQRLHHQHRGFDEEFSMLMERHGLGNLLLEET